MNLIFKWISSFIIEKIVKASFGALTDYFKQRELEKKIKLERERKDRIANENRRLLDLAIAKGNLDEIKQASENYINFIESTHSN